MSLCLLAGSRWMLESGLPQSASTFASECAACLTVALVYATGVLRRRKFGTRFEGDSIKSGVGAALIAAGVLLAQWTAGEHLGGGDASLALALVAVVVAVASSVVRQDGGEDRIAGLWPGLASLAGLLLLLPEPQLQGVRPWLGLCVLPLLTGVGAVLVETYASRSTEAGSGHRLWGLASGIAVAGLLFFPAAMAVRSRGVSIEATILDAVLLLLSLECVRRLGAPGWSAQFFLVPLVSLLESIVLLRPGVQPRAWVGLGLLALGAARQVWLADPGSRREPSVVPSLLGRGDHL